MQPNYAQAIMKLRGIAIAEFGRATRPENCPLSKGEVNTGSTLNLTANVKEGMNIRCQGKEFPACASCTLKNLGINAN